jgi:hypothetical protein
MNATDPIIRPYRLGDEIAVNNGFNEAFRLSRPLAEWAWKFGVDPAGRLIMVAELDGEILAHYAAVPVRFGEDGRIWNAGQIVDVYSAAKARKSFTRRGTWVKTVEAFFDTFGRSGRVPLLFGFPSPRPLRLGVLQLGYDSMPPQPIVYLSRRSPSPPARRRRLLYRAEPARDWEPRLDELWDRVRHRYPVAAIRDAEWAVRRFAGHPTARYHRFLVFPRMAARPVAFVAFRSDTGRCRWVDLIWDHEHPGGLELVRHMSGRLADQTGAELEELWLNGDPEGRARLEEAGFRVSEEPGKLVMVARAFDDRIDLQAFDQRVYITMADADLV